MATEQLPGFLHSVGPLLDRHGYSAVAALILLEDFGVPLPGETILIAASIYAGTGRLNIVAVGLIAVLAAVVGDSLGYALGRFGGGPLIERYGRYIFLTHERLATAQAFYERQGPKIVMFARFVEGLRQANGIIAGLGGMPWPTFLLFNAIGAVLWVAVWTTLGELAGNHITAIYNAFSRYVLVAAALAVLLGIVVLLRHRARRRRRRASADAAQSAAAGANGPEDGVAVEGDERRALPESPAGAAGEGDRN